MHDALSSLLTHSQVWNSFSVDLHESDFIVLRHQRAIDDNSDDLVFHYRHERSGPILIKVIFSREDEEKCNEGMYEMYCWTSNLIDWLGNVIGRPELIMANRSDKDIIEVHDARGALLEEHVGSWMFARY